MRVQGLVLRSEGSGLRVDGLQFSGSRVDRAEGLSTATEGTCTPPRNQTHVYACLVRVELRLCLLVWGFAVDGVDEKGCWSNACTVSRARAQG